MPFISNHCTTVWILGSVVKAWTTIYNERQAAIKVNKVDIEPESFFPIVLEKNMSKIKAPNGKAAIKIAVNASGSCIVSTASNFVYQVLAQNSWRKYELIIDCLLIS